MITPHAGNGLNGTRPPDGDDEDDGEDWDDENDDDDDDDYRAFIDALYAAAAGDPDAARYALRAIDRLLAECPLYPELIIACPEWAVGAGGRTRRGSCGGPNDFCPLCSPGYQC